MNSLRVTEIFYSLQGESRTIGRPTVFIRLTGCPLRCSYCDTAYAFSGGALKTIDAILKEVAAYHPAYITVTGGEPLAQPDCLLLLTGLCDIGAEVSLETSGALPVNQVDSRVQIVMDIKTPGSGEVDKNDFSNLEKLKTSDQIKFVICNRQDYEWARFKMDEMNLCKRFEEVLLSPSKGEMSAQSLAEWILKDKLDVRFQIQLHKILWNDEAGR